MKQENKHNKFVDFRKQFPFFTYQSYSFQIKNQSLEAEFVFNLSDKYIFKPSIRVPGKAFYQFDKVDKQAIEMFVFHMGMVELISYWKAACSPVVIIKPHTLGIDQVNWWKKLYYNGLGEFFY